MSRLYFCASVCSWILFLTHVPEAASARFRTGYAKVFLGQATQVFISTAVLLAFLQTVLWGIPPLNLPLAQPFLLPLALLLAAAGIHRTSDELAAGFIYAFVLSELYAGLSHKLVLLLGCVLLNTAAHILFLGLCKRIALNQRNEGISEFFLRLFYFGVLSLLLRVPGEFFLKWLDALA